MLLIATTDPVREEVRQKYAEAATGAGCGYGDRGCCSDGDITVEFTHEIADGMHGAIVKAVKA